MFKEMFWKMVVINLVLVIGFMLVKGEFNFQYLIPTGIFILTPMIIPLFANKRFFIKSILSVSISLLTAVLFPTYVCLSLIVAVAIALVHDIDSVISNATLSTYVSLVGMTYLVLNYHTDAYVSAVGLLWLVVGSFFAYKAKYLEAEELKKFRG